MAVVVRAEVSVDRRSIHDVLARAFPTAQEAILVERLRETGRLLISLVAESEAGIVGHIAFSPVTIDNRASEVIGVGLAPLAVRPDRQRRGVGAQLVSAGLSACKVAGVGFVVLLGEPDYYRRFGFQKASLWGVANIYGVDEPFMALELCPAAIAPGLLRYAPEFDDLST
ncbi:MAG: GNAT family N-acetyltransferase [Candidatus Binatia bacterium]